MHRIKHDIPESANARKIQSRDILEEVVRLAKKLPIQERVLVSMRYRDGYSFNEIAAACGCCGSTVNRKLKKICEKLLDLKDMDSNYI